LIIVFIQKAKLLANAGESLLKRHHPTSLCIGDAACDRGVERGKFACLLLLVALNANSVPYVAASTFTPNSRAAFTPMIRSFSSAASAQDSTNSTGLGSPTG
jgi:hypothetical protein